MSQNKFLSREQEEEILGAIRVAERLTSGEIRVHIEDSCPEELLDRAAWTFKSLGMHKTALRNGVLIYLSVNDRKFAIIGDAGINRVVPEGFWEEVKSEMVALFAAGSITAGIVKGIERAGEKLQHFFPCQSDDVNELSDEISYGK